MKHCERQYTMVLGRKPLTAHLDGLADALGYRQRAVLPHRARLLPARLAGDEVYLLAQEQRVSVSVAEHILNEVIGCEAETGNPDGVGKLHPRRLTRIYSGFS